MKTTTVCENCKFWNETGGTDDGLVGECHRNSPVPVISEGSVDAAIRFAAWPATLQHQWCGDFEKRPMEAKEVMERMAMIEKMEAERKSKKKAS